MARGFDTGAKRLEFVAQLARELPPDRYDAREVADVARFLTRAQTQLIALRDRAWSQPPNEGDQAKLERIKAQLAQFRETSGIGTWIDWSTWKLRLTLPSGATSGMERGHWEVP